MQENTAQQITPSLSEEAINEIIKYVDTNSLRQFRLVDKKSYIFASGRFFRETIETHRFSSRQYEIFGMVIDESFDSNKLSTNQLLACLLQPNMRHRVGISIEDAMHLAIKYSLHDTVIKLLSEEEKLFIEAPESEIVWRNGGIDGSQTNRKYEDAMERQRSILIEFLGYVKNQLTTFKKNSFSNHRNDVCTPIEKRRRIDKSIDDILQTKYNEEGLTDPMSSLEVAMKYELHDIVIELLSNEENPFIGKLEYETVQRRGGVDYSQTERNRQEAIEEQKSILKEFLHYSRKQLIALQEMRQNSFRSHNYLDVRNVLSEGRESVYIEDEANNNPVRLGL